MSGPAATLTGSQGSRAIGVVAGFVLKLARQSAGFTQDRLAEALGADVTTIQSWESGRRPLSAMSAGEFFRLGARLTWLGAPASTRRHLNEAVEADLVLSTGISAAGRWVDPETHPLAVHVHRRSLTNMITWPLTGVMPPQLAEFRPRVPRRGPVAAQPDLAADSVTRFLDHLLVITERATKTGEALLRRQAVYLLGFDRRPHVADWLREEWQRAGRQPVRDGDISDLMAARSASVALAATGDSTHLHDFVIATSGTAAEVANLNYWAHWLGETSDDQTNDEFMADDTGRWAGVRLLQHLTRRLDPASPHLALNLHTVHALVASRPVLLTGWPGIRAPLDDALDRVASSDVLNHTGRDQVAGLHYALRIADR
jgi:transcriptional regulator with XRE-family HTH domain